MDKVKLPNGLYSMFSLWRVCNSIGNVTWIRTSIRYRACESGLIKELKEKAAPIIGPDLACYNPCMELPAKDFNKTGRTYVHTFGEIVFTFPRIII